MSWILYSRLGIHMLMNGAPILAYQWSTIILPELLKEHFGIDDMKTVSFYASLFYVSYFCGIFLSCFIWPFVVKYVSKRRCLLFSTMMYGIMTLISSYGKSLSFLLICRFITGIFLNENSVGKDLLFEFAKGKFRQIGLSFDSAIALAMNLAGPFIGILIYRSTGDSIQWSLIVIACIYFLISFIFVIFFFFVPYNEKHRNSFKPEEASCRESEAEENKLLIKDKRGKMRIKTRSTKEVLYWCLHHPTLRNPILIYSISLAVTNTDLLMTVILLETSWNESGYGIDPRTLSILCAISVIPACLILFFSPSICPSKIDYSSFMRIFIILFSFGVFLTPLLRDIIPVENHYNFRCMIYLVVFLKNCTNGRLFAPFIHFHLNDKSNRYIRTLINTVNFVCATLFNIILLNLIVPLLSITLYDERFTKYAPYNRYPLFLLLVILQVGCVFLLEEQQNDQVLESVTEI